MIVIPLNTDAPIYHWPWMALVLIAANVATFFLTGGGRETDGWLLQFGHSLHPIEWVAYNFLHFGWLHLIGNMGFLWGFGLIVEGKLGWWRFLLLYLASSRPKRGKPATEATSSHTSSEATESGASNSQRTMSESLLPSATFKVLDRIRELIRAGKPRSANIASV